MEKDNLKRFSKKPRYKLTRKDDGLVRYANRIYWIEWNEDGTYKASHDEPAVERSIVLDPYFGTFTWMTSSVVEIIKKTPCRILFKTKNSTYLLTDKHGKRED